MQVGRVPRFAAVGSEALDMAPVPNPLGAAAAWAWLARVLNQRPAPLLHTPLSQAPTSEYFFANPQTDLKDYYHSHPNTHWLLVMYRREPENPVLPMTCNTGQERPPISSGSP